MSVVVERILGGFRIDGLDLISGFLKSSVKEEIK